MPPNRTLTDMQLELLTRALERDDRLLPRPEGLKGGAALQVAKGLMNQGLACEVPVGSDAPGWFRDAEGSGWRGLQVTAAGREAFSPDPVASGSTDQGERGVKPAESPDPAPAPRARAGTKAALVLSLLTRPEGASLDELVAATGWLPHTTRAALTRLRQKGHDLTRGQNQEGRTTYRIPRTDGGLADGEATTSATLPGSDA